MDNRGLGRFPFLVIPRRHPILALLLGAAWLASSPAEASGPPAPSRSGSPCDEAAKLVARGDASGAAEAYRGCLVAETEGPAAESALYALAEIEDRRLGNYDEAISLYRSLATRFPAGRYRARAEGRAAHIEKARSAGDEPLRLYEGVLQSYASLERAEAVSRMERIAREYPGFPLLPEVLKWLAYQKAEGGDVEGAIEAYEGIARRYAGAPHAFAARASIGTIRMEAGRLAEARAAFEDLAAAPDRLWALRGREMLRRTGELERRRDIHLASLGFLVATCVTLLGGIRWRGIRWPAVRDLCWEVVPLAVVAALVVAVGRQGRASQALWPCLGILAGSMVLVVASGLFLSGRRPLGRWRWPYLAWLALSVACLAYSAAYSAGLISSIERTLVEGPEF